MEVFDCGNVCALTWKFYSQICCIGVKLVLMFLRETGGGNIDLS